MFRSLSEFVLAIVGLFVIAGFAWLLLLGMFWSMGKGADWLIGYFVVLIGLFTLGNYALDD